MVSKRRLSGIWLLAAVVATGGLFAVPGSVAACSCAVFDIASMPDRDDPLVVIGTLTGPQPGGIRFEVERWFSGADSSPVVVLDQRWFHGPIGDCGRDPLPLGIRFIVAMHRQDDGRAGISLCAPIRVAASPEGREWIEQARSRYGEGIAYPTSAVSATIQGLAVFLGLFGSQIRVFPADYEGPLR